MPRPVLLSLVVLASVAAGHMRSSASQLHDVDGVRRDLFAPSGVANVLLFVSSDCPISNGYAPEIQRICGEYRSSGVSCSLVYEDASISAEAVRSHRESFGYRDMPAVIDSTHAIASAMKASITPQAVLVAAGGAVKYRGRIDNRYERIGRPRRIVTAHDLRDALDAVLAQRPVTRPVSEAIGCFIPFGAPRSAPR
jgi:hypothetical protein